MNPRDAKEDQIGGVEELARMRVLVAYLGEYDQFAWWATSYLSRTGQRFLAFNFPRTTLSAGVQAASHAAMRMHDERIGRQGAFHLFRLPYALEREVHALVAGRGANAFAALLVDRDAALTELGALGAQETSEAVGPVRVSTVARILHRSSISRVATVYRRAFTDAAPSFPYYSND